MDKIVKIDFCMLFAMKNTSIAIALVLVFGLFAGAYSLSPAHAQYPTYPTQQQTPTSNMPSAANKTLSGAAGAAGANLTSAANRHYLELQERQAQQQERQELI